jgi:predicted Rossmann-fold nucleotide-binding protein
MEEVFEILTWNQLGIVRKPVVLLDINHYWAPLFDWMDASVEAGFVRSAHRMLAQRARTVEEALALAMAPVPETPSKWLDRDTGPIPIIPRA